MNSADWTALGTIALAVVTLAAVLTTIVITAGDRRGAAARLADERAHSDRQIATEREFSKNQAEEEWHAARDREQLAEAYAVQVVMGEAVVDTDVPTNEYGDPDGSVKRLAALVVNRGKYTITQLEAQFCLSGTQLITPHRTERISGLLDLPAQLHFGWGAPEREWAMSGTLTPWDTGMRFETDRIHVRHLGNSYPVVRWRDQWGTRWEHNRGRVRTVVEGEQWVP